MANICNCLKNAYQDLKEENKRQPTFIFILIVLLAIPLPYAFNSIALGLLLLAALLNFRKFKFRMSLSLGLLPALYVLMAMSYFWSIDSRATLTALSKELPLLLLPLVFMFTGALATQQRIKLLKYYSWGMCLYAVFYLLQATVRYLVSFDKEVFFYHGLVSLDVNAIHVSVYFAVAFFFFYTRKLKSVFEWLAALLLFCLIFLLSSKNIIIVFLLLLLVYHLAYSEMRRRSRAIAVAVILLFTASLACVGKIRNRFEIEYATMTTDATVNEEISQGDAKVYNVSLRQAWFQEEFKGNDFFPGAALRVFQVRIFTEMLQQDNIFWTGYGLNASYPKIKQKVIDHGLYLGDGKNPGYQSLNFHNQYIQNFAELGFPGLLLLLVILGSNLKNTLKSKDFVHISFAVLMISLFLTESFLWRQRGVTFFTMMYCLLNSGLFPAPKNTKD
ncbi:MAG TPA: O-antigen ligase family protein [Flavobacterium sp.]|jgi:O-antigen ligase